MNFPSSSSEPSIAPASEPGQVVVEPTSTLPDAGEQTEHHRSSDTGRRVKSALREIIETFVLALIIFLAVRTFVMNYRVIGHSMQPTIEEGQFLLIDKPLYNMGEPRRGDVVVLNPPDAPGQIYIKRVIGIPGDVVEIKNGQVFINEQALLEPWETRPYPASNWGPGRVGTDEVLVLGDNRPGSRDSRYFGMLPQEKIIGRAFLSYWPPDTWGAYSRYDPESLRIAE